MKTPTTLYTVFDAARGLYVYADMRWLKWSGLPRASATVTDKDKCDRLITRFENIRLGRIAELTGYINDANHGGGRAFLEKERTDLKNTKLVLVELAPKML